MTGAGDWDAEPGAARDGAGQSPPSGAGNWDAEPGAARGSAGPASTGQDWRAERLPCGRELGDIVEQVVDGNGDDLDAHQGTCRYCQAALEDTERLWNPVRRFVAEPLEVPDELVESLVRRVRRLVGLGWITLTRTRRGITRASGWIVAAIAEAVADRTPGVSRVGSSAGRVVEKLAAARPAGAGEQSAAGGRAVEVGDRQVAVDLDLVGEFGPSIAEVAERVRRGVRAEVTELTGLDVVEVNVLVSDVDDAAARV